VGTSDSDDNELELALNYIKVKNENYLGLYYYNPKGGPATKQTSGVQTGVRKGETRESKNSTTFIFVLVYRGGLPGSCTTQGMISLALVSPCLGLGWSSRGSVAPKVARGWTVLFPGISCSRRRSSSGLHRVVSPRGGVDVGRSVRRNRTP
jgi:hypothetical protein